MTRQARRRSVLAAALLILLITGCDAEAGRLVINKGGTYSGTFESNDPKVAAVTINTSEPVILERSIIRGRGDLIVSHYKHANVTIRHVRAEGLYPNAAGRCAGRFVELEGFDNVSIENCSLQGTSGIYLLDYAGDRTSRNTVRITRNVVRNIDGRIATSKGRYSNKARLVQFVQLDKVRRVPGMRIEWNEVINEPGKSRVEDVINIYLSSGTPESPLRINNNYIRGAYPTDAAKGSYSGGGILLGDGVSDEGPAGDSSYVEAYDNQVIDTVNYGIAIAAGHNLRFYRNRILSAGTLPSGKRIRAQNVGAYIWDSYKAGRKRFYANSASDNLVGWTNAKGGRNDWWHPHSASWSDNVHWPGTLRTTLYDLERARWQAKLKAADVRLGPKRAP